jgi:hypothetical protein
MERSRASLNGAVSELDHQGIDRLLVLGELVEGADLLLGGGLPAKLLGPLLDDPLLGADGREDLRLDLAIEGLASGRVHLLGGADDGLGQAKGVECRLGVAFVQEGARGLEPLAHVIRELLPEDGLGLDGVLDRGPRLSLRLRRNLVADRFFQSHPPHARQTIEGAPGVGVARVERQHLAIECLRLGRIALRQRLPPQVEQLIGERRGWLAPRHRAGQEQAAQRPLQSAPPRSIAPFHPVVPPRLQARPKTIGKFTLENFDELPDVGAHRGRLPVVPAVGAIVGTTARSMDGPSTPGDGEDAHPCRARGRGTGRLVQWSTTARLFMS